MLELLFVHYLALYRVAIYYLLSLYILLIFMLWKSSRNKLNGIEKKMLETLNNNIGYLAMYIQIHIGVWGGGLQPPPPPPPLQFFK